MPANRTRIRQLLRAGPGAFALALCAWASAAVAQEPAQQAGAQEAGAQQPGALEPAAQPALTPPPVDPSLPGTALEGVQDQDPREAALRRPRDRFWRISGGAQYRSLLVTDEDPANDRYMLYHAQGSYYPLPWLSVFARFGLNQRFVSVEGESGFRLEDTTLGATAEQKLDLEKPLGWSRTLSLVHALRVFLPTSFASQQQDLYFALDGSTRASVEPINDLVTGLRGRLHYRFHEYAEQAGPGGGTLPRFVVELTPFIEYSPPMKKKWGVLTVGADVHADETIDYPSRDPGNIPADQLPPGTLGTSSGGVAESGSSDSYVTPHYGYDVYVVYTPPIPHVSFSLSLEQAGNVVRYGEPRLYFLHRDQTEIALRVVGTY